MLSADEEPVKLKVKAPFPAEYRAEVLGYIRRHAHILPTWCHEIVVRYAIDKELSGACEATPQYRFARLFIANGYPQQSPAEREDTVVHELTHVPLWPMMERGRELIEQLYDGDEAGKEDQLKQWEKIYEGVTCDLTVAFLKARGKR